MSTTQPLTAEQEDMIRRRLEEDVQLLGELPAPYELRPLQTYEHMHGPFTFLMNQNHNALRGCQACGAAWVGSMAGDADNLVWHPVGELSEEA